MRAKAAIGAVVLVCAASASSGQSPAPPPSAPSPSTSPPPGDAAATDPVRLGWMQGSPPPADRAIRWADGSYLRFPQTRWSFSHLSEFLPSATVSRGDGPVSALPKRLRTDLDAVTFTPIGGGRAMTWAEGLAASYTDAILVLHRGRIVYERYFGVTTPATTHANFSVTKSYFGALAAAMFADGTMDPEMPVTTLIPELGPGGFAGATLRQVADMTTGVEFEEDYTKPTSGIVAYSLAAGLMPRPAGYTGERSINAYLPTVPRAHPHGQRFTYRSVNTDVLAWAMARVTGKRPHELLTERIWQPMGMESDARMVLDSDGTAFASAGLNSVLRDQARFGEMIRLGGRWNGRQILPKAAIDDIRQGGRVADFARANYATLPGWSYRDQWWVSHNSHGAFMARGIHGQAIYVDPAAAMVIVRFASNWRASNKLIDPVSLPAYDAMARKLMGRAR